MIKVSKKIRESIETNFTHDDHYTIVKEISINSMLGGFKNCCEVDEELINQFKRLV